MSKFSDNLSITKRFNLYLTGRIIIGDTNYRPKAERISLSMSRAIAN